MPNNTKTSPSGERATSVTDWTLRSITIAVLLIALCAIPVSSMTLPVDRPANASSWRYFEYGNGINSASLLPRGWIGGDWFNFWDFGMAVDGTVAGYRNGLIGQAEYQSRIDGLLGFLETMQLDANGTPYYSYRWDTGAPASSGGMDAADTGRTFNALGFLRRSDPSYASRIDSMLGGRLKPWIDTVAGCSFTSGFDVYRRDIFLGLTYFRYLNSQYDKSSWLDSFYSVWTSNDRVTDAYGNSMPKLGANLGPVSYELLENGDDYSRTLLYASEMKSWASRRYQATGKFGVWGSEFHVKLWDGSTPFAWEWYVANVPNVGFVTWQAKVLDGPWLSESDPSLASTVSSIDAAYSLHAVFTTDTWMSSMIERFAENDLRTNCGFSEAIFEVTNTPEPTVSISHNAVILLAETSRTSLQVEFICPSGKGYVVSLDIAIGNFSRKCAIRSEERTFAPQLLRIFVEEPTFSRY